MKKIKQRIQNWSKSGDVKETVCVIQCCQLSQIIQETPDFGPYLLVSRLELKISWIIAEVCHFFSRLNFPTIKFQHYFALFVCSHQIKRFLINGSGMSS